MGYKVMEMVCIIGAGFAGSVVARELADAGRRVHVIDKRPHIAGNAYDEYDAHGVLIHNYGPHIFIPTASVFLNICLALPHGALMSTGFVPFLTVKPIRSLSTAIR